MSRQKKPLEKQRKVHTAKVPKLAPAQKKINALQWVFEPLEERTDYNQKKMFGCEAAYLGDRLVLVVADGKEPWNGILLPTERDCHEDLMSLFTHLRPHEVLGKWLYLSQTDPTFEETALEIVSRIDAEDPRFGVLVERKLKPSRKPSVLKTRTPKKKKKTKQ